MQENMGVIDRGIRVVLGTILLGLLFTGPETPWGILGLPLLITAALGRCPAFHLLRVSTCEWGSCYDKDCKGGHCP